MERIENTFGSKKIGVNERAVEQNKDRLNGGYGGDYFDENEHRAGQEKYDLATGQRYQNDGNVESSHAFLCEEKSTINSEFSEDDEVTKLLLANGYHKFGNKINPAA